MPSVVHIHPSELADRREALVIDIRQTEERFSDIGWIPGSRWLPEPIRAEDLKEQDQRTIVLACMSGRRSTELAERFMEEGFSAVVDLQGGILEWGASGLPICRPQPPRGQPAASPEELRRLVKSCFLVESVEAVGLDEAVAQRALETVAAAFPDDVPLQRREVERRIDQLAEMAWTYGHRLDSIVHNVESFYALAADLPE